MEMIKKIFWRYGGAILLLASWEQRSADMQLMGSMILQ